MLNSIILKISAIIASLSMLISGGAKQPSLGGEALSASTTPAIDYTDRNNLIASTTIQTKINNALDTIDTLQAVNLTNKKRYFNSKAIPELGLIPFQVQVFENKTQVGKNVVVGYQTLFFITVNGKQYFKSVNTGAELYKNFDWQPY